MDGIRKRFEQSFLCCEGEVQERGRKRGVNAVNGSGVNAGVQHCQKWHSSIGKDDIFVGGDGEMYPGGEDNASSLSMCSKADDAVVNFAARWTGKHGGGIEPRTAYGRRMSVGRSQSPPPKKSPRQKSPETRKSPRDGAHVGCAGVTPPKLLFTGPLGRKLGIAQNAHYVPGIGESVPRLFASQISSRAQNHHRGSLHLECSHRQHHHGVSPRRTASPPHHHHRHGEFSSHQAGSTSHHHHEQSPASPFVAEQTSVQHDGRRRDSNANAKSRVSLSTSHSSSPHLRHHHAVAEVERYEMSKQGFIAVGGVSNSHREEFEAKVLEFKTPEMEREVMRRRHQVTELSNQNIKESLRTVNGYNNDVVTRLRRFGAADNRSYDDSKLYQHESTNRDIHGRKCTCLKCLQADTGGDVVRLGTEDNLYFGPQWK